MVIFNIPKHATPVVLYDMSPTLPTKSDGPEYRHYLPCISMIAGTLAAHRAPTNKEEEMKRGGLLGENGRRATGTATAGGHGSECFAFSFSFMHILQCYLIITPPPSFYEVH